jgi:hypothetical protein
MLNVLEYGELCHENDCAASAEQHGLTQLLRLGIATERVLNLQVQTLSPISEHPIYTPKRIGQ